MTASVRLLGFGPPDDRWKEMAEVYFACRRAGVTVPDEVESYFDEGAPEPIGKDTDLTHLTKEWDVPSGWPALGLEIEVSKIPGNIELLRFYYSA